MDHNMTETVENKVDITLPRDFSKISEATRESIYYLESLENLFKYHIVLPENYDKKKYDERIKRIINYKDEFVILEEIFYYPKKEDRNTDGLYKVEFSSAKEYVEYVIKYIMLKEKIDELQYEILEYLYNIENEIIKNFTEDKEHLNHLKTQYYVKSLSYSAFEHSKDEDRLDNFMIYLSDSEVQKEFKAENPYPIRLKIRNYDFIIKKYRNVYKLTKESQIDLIFGSSRIEEEIQLKKINVQQFDLNKKVKRINIIAILIAVIGLIYGSINTYYIIKNELSKDKPNTEDQNIHKTEIRSSLNATYSRSDSL
ncbi:MAG: hypothetical protein ACOCUI_05505 [bacterium]